MRSSLAPSATLAFHRTSTRQRSFLACASSLTFLSTPAPLNSFMIDRKSTRLNSSHRTTSYAVVCLNKKTQLMQGKPRVIGFLIQKELKFLGEAITNPRRPFVAILAGVKVTDKINVIEKLLEQADTLLIGGAMAYTFFLAQGKEVGKSLVERDKLDLAKDLLAKAGAKIKLPIDNIISDKMTDDAQTRIVEGDIQDDMEGF